MKQSVAEFASNRGELENRSKDLGPFAKSAENLWRAGLAPIPVGGEDGKKPLVTRFTEWELRPGLNTIRKWIDRYPDENVGIVIGRLSGISVVDIDSADPTMQHAIIERFGDTPLKTRTPSGGCHLWYQHNGEASADSAQIFRFKSKHLAELSSCLRVYGRVVLMRVVDMSSSKDHWMISFE